MIKMGKMSFFDLARKPVAAFGRFPVLLQRLDVLQPGAAAAHVDKHKRERQRRHGHDEVFQLGPVFQFCF